MLEIRPDQMQMFLDRARRTFQDRVLTYLRTTHKDQTSPMPDDELSALTQRLTTAAATYGIQTEAPVVQFIEIGLVFGEDFHNSGQFPAAESILTGEGDGTSKMQALREAAGKGFQP